MYFIILYDETTGEVEKIMSFGDDADKAFEVLDQKIDERLDSGNRHLSANLVTAKDPADLKHIWRRFFHNKR